MKLKDFTYPLPEELIAQHPRPERDASRMMRLNRREKSLLDSRFAALPDFLAAGDVLVVNDSRVIPARLYGKKKTGAILEILLLSRKDTSGQTQLWEVLARPGKRIREEDTIDLGHGAKGAVVARLSEKKWLMSFCAPDGFDAHLERFGRAPLPPYIKRKKSADPDQAADRDRYQTVYARPAGSIAAPTAGLHFTENVLAALRSRGVQIASVTLHVGIGTFLPIEAENVEDHVMQKEYFEISEEAARIINAACRVIAVGTTSTRTLESAADRDGRVRPQSGETGLYIYPGYAFKRVDGLLTNFHLPQSSLFLLVSAFAGTDFIREAYDRAVKQRYLFYSYGDCMLIL
ncbi:MAG: tRNA preQ1(34) S-adenosylmethionine ribosyltransferase-isomerase QueA [Smithellaceae bacterium]|nr:tRNA preQ1(34) S-adenosylmethionine ribosyltransferase-isomerase QueA [Syntrophaceae bacterium]MDD4240412.1 tRNA preQ1(34) S-adenosylmethionine ribosyltransferase-isomerase QueA [Smithellaceae bacterium]NLX52083.1 tRNA preQ1(34) S-adenosylmethionine ribosyltransferase-isomerase QueA [Deltaproteobacteria bacterium]